MADISDWLYRLLWGRFASYVAGGKDNPKTIIKWAQTISSKETIGPEALSRILDEVEKDSVQPFLQLRPPWYQPDRLERFKLLKVGLSG